ncbi:MAG: hypothetical protein H0T12_05910, partial [Actinobacteria bacterium]|nr:hypothetical protein [Actinomycetota bacterium]
DGIQGEAGDDVLFGGRGQDTLSFTENCCDYSYDSGSVLVNLARGTAVATDGTDTLGAFEFVIGSQADDILKGGKRADQLSGNLGSDMLRGRRGDDHLFGFDGHDSLHGGQGNNSNDGGRGFDVCHDPGTTGGAKDCES